MAEARTDPPRRGTVAAPMACLAAALTMATGCTAAPEPPEDGVRLVLGDSYPVGHPISENGAEFFMERAEELTGGRVTFSYLPSEQIGTAADLIELTGSGAIDMASVAPAYVTSKLPLSGVADLPGLVGGACEGALAAEPLMAPGGVLYDEELSERGVRPLVIGVIPSYEVMTGTEEVAVPSDAAGMMLRSSGGTIDATISALGGSPVSMPAPEMYEAISRGTVDGTALAPISAEPYRLDEAAGYSTLGAELGSFINTYSIGDDAWQRLDTETREALVQAGHETTLHLCEALDEENAASQQRLAEGGMEFHPLTDEEKDAWQEVLAPAREQWAADMESIGRPGEEALAAMETELERVREEQADGGE